MPIKVRYNGVWSKGVPYIKQGGVWVKAPMYVKQGGTWYILTFDDPGSITYTTAGVFNFIVPNYETFLTVKGWGGGGSGGGNNTSNLIYNGTAGGATKFGSLMTANGGSAGSIGGGTPSGGTATGGTINTQGGSGAVNNGGSSPNGGDGGTSGSRHGKAPGGGGLGYSFASGGGAGGYFERTYSRGQLTPGTTIAVEVAAGVTASTSFTGDGARGELRITWG